MSTLGSKPWWWWTRKYSAYQAYIMHTLSHAHTHAHQRAHARTHARTHAHTFYSWDQKNGHGSHACSFMHAWEYMIHLADHCHDHYLEQRFIWRERSMLIKGALLPLYIGFVRSALYRPVWICLFRKTYRYNYYVVPPYYISRPTAIHGQIKQGAQHKIAFTFSLLGLLKAGALFDAWHIVSHMPSRERHVEN